VRLIASVASLAAALFALPVQAFRQVQPGAPLPDRILPTVDGRRASLVAQGKVSVFVFVRTQHDHSESALRQLATLERELAHRPVQLVAVVSDGEVPADVQELTRATGVRMPVLIDRGDALYGELGVAMYPSAGIVGRDGRLSSFQPFRKINYLDAMRGRVQVALGELDEKALAAILDPGAAPPPTGSGRAHARLKLARTLLAAGLVDPALESARAAVALDPALGEGHQVLSDALARAGRCEEAGQEAALARKLSPSIHPTALACRH
jgi:hypothetical protein